MGGDIETIKERLDIVEIVGAHVKLEKAGVSYKGRCPFHNEKTPSFFVSPARQNYYCFGCGAKGDIFTFVQETEGLSFKEVLRDLAERAGVELKNMRLSREAKSEKESLFEVLEEATQFFQNKLLSNETAQEYLRSRGLNEKSLKEWRIGYAPAEWRALYHHLLARGFKSELILKAGLAKPVTGASKEPYDVFRDRLMFPLFDPNGEVVAFSGRALGQGVEPKYINTPETPLFTKSELLYGLDKAKSEIRKKNYTVLVEGQMDLVLSHQVGVNNTVASSGTAFTSRHLERLKKLSPRIILAFDGDSAGIKASEKSTELALSLGLEVKVAKLPEGQDPADLAKSKPEEWKQVLRDSKSAIEHFLTLTLESESDRRKALKLVESKILPLLSLLNSSMERSHFISLIAKRTGLKEEVIWEDLRKIKVPLAGGSRVSDLSAKSLESSELKVRSRKEEMQEVAELLKESPQDKDLLRHHEELSHLVRIDELDLAIEECRMKVAHGDEEALAEVAKLSKQRDEERRKM